MFASRIPRAAAATTMRRTQDDPAGLPKPAAKGV
jgi:hypothetical protein